MTLAAAATPNTDALTLAGTARHTGPDLRSKVAVKATATPASWPAAHAYLAVPSSGTREVAVGLIQGRIRPDSRWRSRDRGRARRRAGVPEPESPALPALPALLACPVAADQLTADGLAAHGLAAHELAAADHEAGLAAGQGAFPVGRALAGDGSCSLDGVLASAERFITMFYAENQAGSPGLRLRQVRHEIEATGTYWHTPAELEFGARVAWRNSSRCIGRLYWHSLRVRDRRGVTAATDIAAESVAHLREATNDGRVRPMITVFAQDAPDRPGPRILSSQIVRYAGYETAGGNETGAGHVTGDPANASLTRLARDLGWPGSRPAGRFDVLPLIVQEAGAPVTLHELPADAVLQVPIEHPEFGWFGALGLRWYAVPVISDMYLDIGGVCYPAAPFNGWYMGTEIGSRDLGDTGRYDQLPVIAAHMGLSTASDRTLWKDKAITELNLAVLHSFSAAGVTISDHHTESARFLRHLEREQRQGRACPADWTWIVPPAASSATPVFHRYYQDFDQAPNYYRHPMHPSLASPRSCPPMARDLRLAAPGLPHCGPAQEAAPGSAADPSLAAG